MRAAGPGRFLKRAAFRTGYTVFSVIEMKTPESTSRVSARPVERCLACEADGEQGKTALRVLFDFYAL